MYRCSCGYETHSRERLAGHRSGHARRGEIVEAIHACPECEMTFPDYTQLGAHVTNTHRTCNKPLSFEELKTNGRRKRILLEERGRKCERCGRSDWEGEPIPLDTDHIDGNTENNAKENLRLLCCNCHALTPTYKGKNIGKYDTAKSRYFKRYNIRSAS